MDLNFVLLLLLSFIYALFYMFDPVGGIQYAIFYAVFPPVFYLLGKFLITENIPQYTIYLLLFLIGFVFSFSALVSVILNFLEGGFSQLDRSLPMFWPGSGLVSATKMGGFFTLNMCIPALLIGNQSKSKLIYKLIGIAIFIFSIVCVIRLGSRTQLGIMLITCFVSLIYVAPKQSFKKNVLLFLLISGIGFYIYSNVSFDLNEDWLSTFAGRMDKGAGDIASGGGRTERWIKSFEYMFEKPLGWSVNEFGFAHNLWLDVLRVTGIIPFIILIIFSVRSFRTIKKTISFKSNQLYFSVQILIYSIAFFMLFMVEPIFDGMFEMFTIFCVFIGILCKYREVQHTPIFGTSIQQN
ncbi:hypothetical protein FEE95_18000 [Maribacter algarum]|uniref:O-antigen ligase domain-containing protein n=1 Tax=Maribacter algarum (ex Zhang et al. 2020) TaxID=2578118 RepID=A0A5S3PJZ0_9FLAO|nr:hypothetical protein [Maribacter algarum]TMM53791.1 hypothetical protein FEE95_18000 [Maribacter algarum]